MSETERYLKQRFKERSQTSVGHADAVYDGSEPKGKDNVEPEATSPWAYYCGYCIFCGLGLLVLFLASLFPCKLTIVVSSMALFWLAVQTIGVFSCKQWQSIVAVLLTAPLVGYLIYLIFQFMG